MSEAIYGLIGALGGAILGGAATLTASSLTGRHAGRQELRVRKELEFERMMDLRRATRDVLLILDDAQQALERGKPIDTSGLPEAVKKMREAADRCEVYGLRFEHSRSSAANARPATPGTESLRELVAWATLMEECLGRAAAAEGEQRQDLKLEVATHYLRAEGARRKVLGVLMDRMEELREEMRGQVHPRETVRRGRSSGSRTAAGPHGMTGSVERATLPAFGGNRASRSSGPGSQLTERAAAAPGDKSPARPSRAPLRPARSTVSNHGHNASPSLRNDFGHPRSRLRRRPLEHTNRRNQCHTRNCSPPRKSSPTRRSS